MARVIRDQKLKVKSQNDTQKWEMLFVAVWGGLINSLLAFAVTFYIFVFDFYIRIRLGVGAEGIGRAVSVVNTLSTSHTLVWSTKGCL